MRAGRLRHRVVFLEPVAVREPNGSEVISYAPRFRRWGAVEPIKGAEAMRGNQPLGVMDTRILVRWSPEIDGVSDKWRATHRGAVYGLVSIVNTKTADREVEIMAKSGAI